MRTHQSAFVAVLAVLLLLVAAPMPSIADDANSDGPLQSNATTGSGLLTAPALSNAGKPRGASLIGLSRRCGWDSNLWHCRNVSDDEWCCQDSETTHLCSGYQGTNRTVCAVLETDEDVKEAQQSCSTLLTCN